MKIPTVCASLLFVFTTAAFSQEYDVHFFRPSKAGDKYTGRMKFSTDDDQQVTMNGNPAADNKKTKLDLDMTADIEEVAVDATGRPTEEKFTVKSCEATQDGASASVFKTGDEIHMKEKQGAPKEFKVNGQPAEGLAAAVLRDMFPQSHGDRNNDDKVFGAGHKVKVGDSWPVNAEFAAADLSKELGGVEIPKDAVKGTVTLESANAKDGIPCLQVSGVIQINAAGVPIPGGPPGIVAKTFETSAKISGDLPVDPSLQARGSLLELHVKIDGGGTVESGGQKLDIGLHLSKIQKREATVITKP